MEQKEHARLILVRHCETAWNAEKRLQGQTDIPLNEKGRSQAGALGDALKGETFHAIYASDLKRAHQTAEAIAEHHSLSVVPHAAFREGHYGEAEGLVIDEYHRRFKKGLSDYEELPYQEKLKISPVPGAESRFEIATRVEGGLKQLALSYKQQTILVVTHGGVIRALLMYLSEKYASPPFIPNGARLHLLSDGTELTIESLHL